MDNNRDIQEELQFLRLKNMALEKELNSVRMALKQEKFLANTLESIRECVSITDLNDKIIYVNKAFLNTYGFVKEELIGRNISIVRSTKNDPNVLKSILPGTIKGGWTGEIYNRKKDGTDFLISLSTSIVRDENSRPIALVGASIDITDKKKSEEALKKSEENYRSLFEETKDVVYVTSPEGKFIELNQAGLDLFGFSTIDEMRDIDIAKEIYVNPEEHTIFKEELEKKGYLKDYEISLRTRNGKVIYITETSSALKDKEGRVVAYRGILRDVTYIKQSEAQLKELVSELQKKKQELEMTTCKLGALNKQLFKSEEELKTSNAAKDKFFSIIAHDLRSPFTSLIGLSGIIVSDCDTMSNEEIKSFVINIHKSAMNVFNLLENLLQWSRIQTGRMEYVPAKFDIYDIVEQAISVLLGNAVKKGIDIISEVPLNSLVIADCNMVSSVIQNLISNSIKFTNRGGTVKISVNELVKYFEISVSDNGVGIPQKDIDKLFRIDVHHTTAGTGNEKGTGLGLILCKELIEKNGGKIWAESTPGEGTTFRFTLPKHEK
ncbi:MAG: PAS domain-containing sensor histidine kinase [Bacteroidota bacterium]|nr:PAS domain-containing sensor histidine kinase [Bacteroidota bacterium]MDP4190014.1 PAS domain-containing sensor histidine kinase [Bacteroidota bacterium]MDP4193446.1 PAS domain-containing sensor histidine kinase [Bacteroidota bacterium]